MTEQEQMVEDCENGEQRLTDWERGFIDSIGKVLREGGELTEKQAEALERVWERATS